MVAREKNLKDLEAIKNLMERSTRFLSLSGLSGISAGLVALVATIFTLVYLSYDIRYLNINRYFEDGINLQFEGKSIWVLFNTAIITLIVALFSAYYFSYKKAKRNKTKFWTSSTKRLVINMLIPLTTGGLLCLIFMLNHMIMLVAPLTLVFYGLSLVSASNYTLNEIRYLGFTEIVLGIIATWFIGYGLLFWALGFGLAHIVYGSYIYIKYDR